MTEPRSIRYRYLLGAMQQIQVSMIIRAQGIEEEASRLTEIIERWRRASQRMQELMRTDVGAADDLDTHNPPDDIKGRLAEIEADPLFRASFSLVPTKFLMVNVNHLVAPQREVNLDYVASLMKRVPSD